MPTGRRVALAGFSAFERSALALSFLQSASRSIVYVEVGPLAEADFILADADHPGVVDAVLNARREADTVFVGGEAPEGAMLWLMRPIDPMHILRDLDAMTALREPLGMPPTPLPHGAPARAGADLQRPLRRASDIQPATDEQG